MAVHVFPSGITADRRKALRQRTLISCTLRENNKTSTWSALVRNISDDGARIEVSNAFWIPNNFELEISARDLRRSAEVIWRDGGLLGIKFKATPAAGIQAKEELNHLRQEREHLRRRITQLSE